MNPTVSIIVPVYNAQKSLNRCVDSILTQAYQDFELLLVNDGSTDGSGEICRQYRQKDPRVRVIEKENTGVSDTRNLALDQARGEFLQFVDSDDWITADATSLMARAAKDYHCDMVICDFYRVVGDRVSHKGDIEEDGVISREEFAGYMMENPADFYYGVLWNKLFKREIVEKYHLRMDADISWCEDFMFNLEYIRHVERIYALPVPVYYYVKTKGSLASQGMSLSKTIQMKRMVFEYYHAFYKDVLTEEDYEKNRLQVYRFLVDAAGDGNVPFSVFPGTKKLGDERSSVNRKALESQGKLMDFYRDRKLATHFMESVALKYGLTLMEAWLLLFFDQGPQMETLKELSDVTGILRRHLAPAMQKLTARELIKSEERVKITLLPEAGKVLRDLKLAWEDYEAEKFSGFSQEEREQYERFSDRINENVKRVLL